MFKYLKQIFDLLFDRSKLPNPPLERSKFPPVFENKIIHFKVIDDAIDLEKANIHEKEVHHENGYVSSSFKEVDLYGGVDKDSLANIVVAWIYINYGRNVPNLKQLPLKRFHSQFDVSRIANGDSITIRCNNGNLISESNFLNGVVLIKNKNLLKIKLYRRLSDSMINRLEERKFNVDINDDKTVSKRVENDT